MIEVIVDQGDLIKAKQALTSLEAENFIRPELPGYVRSVMAVAEVYPPEVTGSRYKRTGTIKESWSSDVRSLEVEIKNLAPYSGFVLARNPKQRRTAELKPGRDRKAMSMGWKAAWKQTGTVMLDQMDEWIYQMERKAFRLWER